MMGERLHKYAALLVAAKRGMCSGGVNLIYSSTGTVGNAGKEWLSAIHGYNAIAGGGYSGRLLNKWVESLQLSSLHSSVQML